MSSIKIKLRESLDRSEFENLVNIVLNTKNTTNTEWAKKYVTNFINTINKLPNEIKLYRVVFVNSIDDIDRTKIGTHYSPNRRKLEQSHSSNSHVGGGNPYILTVKVDKNLIDFRFNVKK